MDTGFQTFSLNKMMSLYKLKKFALEPWEILPLPEGLNQMQIP